ncbi:MAG: DUF6033 family protein [Lachnospiraceae bacterium]|nr:DUF6033 family protein [Lachnospiraceae bacterium]
MSMSAIGGLYNNYAAQNVNDKTKKKEVENSKRTDSKAQSGEVKKPQLSTAAQKLLEKLQKTYRNMDFMVYEDGQDAKELLSQGTKEISVLFSSDELEKMASDEKCEKEYMDRLQGALRMSDEINQKFGFKSAFGEDGAQISKIGFVFEADGKMTIFAELEKSSAMQSERIERAREEKRAERRENEKKAEKEIQSYSQISADTKRASVQADSLEELLKKITEIDWDAIKAEKTPESGGKFDFSV